MAGTRTRVRRIAVTQPPRRSSRGRPTPRLQGAADVAPQPAVDQGHGRVATPPPSASASLASSVQLKADAPGSPIDYRCGGTDIGKAVIQPHLHRLTSCMSLSLLALAL